ncbi:hypothetical protein LEP1GSC137_1927 [Leptospira borgpetersenii str. Noumea 25]|nr:hypothetical protein LEP1GSC137_1927 [Leptospira borgpetersenii str. Noumea 25]
MTIIDLRIGFIIVKLSWEFPHFRGFETGSDMAPPSGAVNIFSHFF